MKPTSLTDTTPATEVPKRISMVCFFRRPVQLDPEAPSPWSPVMPTDLPAELNDPEVVGNLVGDPTLCVTGGDGFEYRAVDMDRLEREVDKYLDLLEQATAEFQAQINNAPDDDDGDD